MRKAIFAKFLQVILVVLFLSTFIFYIASSSALLKNSRKDMLYTLSAIDKVLDYNGNFMGEVDKLKTVLNEKQGRFTIIQMDGTVIADTGDVPVSSLDNHSERTEVKEAKEEGTGYSRRYSDTLKENMLYVAIRSTESDFILRMAIPYTGMKEYLMLLLPAVWLTFLIAIMYSAFSADNFAESITKPLKEISQEMLKVKGDYTDLSFETYQYPEINIIAETTTKMSKNVKEYLNQIDMEKQIRQEFFSNASHELKTPITSVQGYAELLESGIIQEEGQKRDFLNRIKKEAANMNNLINDILMISRLETKDAEVLKTNVRLSIVLDDIIESIKPLAASHEVLIHMDCKPVCIYANTQQMKELFGNLISNAVKYNKPGGEVWVKVREEDRNLIVQVKDNGVGIPKESLSRIFERFYRVDKGRSKKQGGTGLGLSIVKHIVNFYHGTISVRSELDKETEFTVNIPIKGKV
ncbi:sensor histidine kinase [Lacrimispora algidixylanolytica]|uniref:histidine kinase n=1 Tax=Lacrimispora algidixylanolytica TaxID=94868 RepID=A0A419SSQ9_9FIRM|nr:ATP-binding protein [Lacrimispora algidixylanolytica]RKD28192.1 two-component sensor histidine kinase [Lacrimispora algidixylanolytica]